MRRILYRKTYARDHLELFLVSAVSSLLLLRFYLSAAGYPQVGGGSLHIAHMLWGGLLMLVAIVINLSFLGIRAQRASALVGGVGFGIFIDELGKFITRDNNYFFRPTIGIIYAVFTILYLSFNFLTRDQRLTSKEYQLNALQQFEEAVLMDMDRHEKATARTLLAKADPDSVITQEMMALLKRVPTVPPSNNWLQRLRQRLAKAYGSFWRQRRSSQLVAAIFVVESLVFLVVVLANLINGFNSIHDLLHHTDAYATKLLIGQLAASVVAAVFAVIGAVRLPTSRLEAFEFFRRAVLVNLFLTEFFIFSRLQFRALPGFLVNLFLLTALHAALSQERHT